MTENATAVHALETANTYRRRNAAPDESSAAPETEKLIGDHGVDDEQGEMEGDEPPPDDCVTFLIVAAVMVGMVGLLWFAFAHLAAPSELLSQRLQNAPKVEAKHIHVHVDLAQLYSGYVARVDVDRQLVCRQCAGSGFDRREGFHECHDCKGSGVRTYVQQIGPIKQHIRSACNVCKGRGKVANKHCDSCHGRGLVRDRKTVDVAIAPGARNGDTVTISNEGDQASRAMPGDLVVHVHVHPHQTFTRRGDDLEVEVEISLVEALAGFTRELRHVDAGRVVRLSRDEVVTSTTLWRLKGDGMPVFGHKDSYGDLVVRFVIQYPKTLAEADKLRVAELLG